MSFRQRIISTFLVFAFVLTLTFGFLLDGLMTVVEDRVVDDLLQEHMQIVEEGLRNPQQGEGLISTKKLKGYLSSSNDFPTRFSKLADGFHETESAHVLVKTLVSGKHANQKVVLEFDESQSFLDQNELYIKLVIVSTILLVLLLTSVICFYLARSIASPIESLAESVTSQRGNLSDRAELHREDELGSLARAFSESLLQIHQLLEREKNFTRYASHELRTPLTVVKSNVDLLKLLQARSSENAKPENQAPRFENAIKRMEQAIWFMEEQIKTLLLLARGEYTPQLEYLDLADIVSGVENYFPDLVLEKDYAKNTRVYADHTVMLNIFTSIFKNVVDHGINDEGKVSAKIQARETGFIVSNANLAKANYAEGKRFGLEIATQLCEVLNWKCAFYESEVEGRNQFNIVVTY